MTAVKKFFSGGRRNDVDMTQGSIIGNIIRFALPLVFGNLFQQLYNMVDTWVIGNFGLKAEYAAVGSIGPVTNILIGFFLGFSSGAGVIISQYYGAKDEKRVSKVVHTSLMATLLLGVIFTVVGILVSPYILQFMLRGESDSNEVYGYARTYLTIYFAGVIGLMIYNIGAGILRAVGDSRRPFYFLVASALTNIVLDLVFVICFGMGVAGVALATIISQFVSAILVVIVLLRSHSCIRLLVKELRLDFSMLGKIVKIGFPAALQMAITSFSNVFVQSYIASIDPVANQTVHMAAWTTYSKVDQLLFLPLQSIAIAATTFVGQNLGTGNITRAKKGARTAYLLATGTAVVLMIPVLAFSPYLAAIFNSDPEVVALAASFQRHITPFFLCCCVNQIFAAVMRGAGNATAPMFIMLGTFVGFRQLYLAVMSNFISNSAIPIGMGYPAGWFACAVCMLVYYFLGFDYSKSRLVEKNTEHPEPDPA